MDKCPRCGVAFGWSFADDEACDHCGWGHEGDLPDGMHPDEMIALIGTKPPVKPTPIEPRKAPEIFIQTTFDWRRK